MELDPRGVETALGASVVMVVVVAMAVVMVVVAARERVCDRAWNGWRGWRWGGRAWCAFAEVGW